MDLTSNRNRITRFLRSLVQEQPAELPLALVLRHVSINDRQVDVATFAPQKLAEGGEQEASLGELVKRICDAIDNDVDGLGGVQRYLLIAVLDQRPVGRLPLRCAASGADSGSIDAIESEPATPKGLLAQLMRHNEAQTRMFALSVGQVISTMQRTIARLQESAEIGEERRLEAVALTEDLLSQKHKRDLMTEKAALDYTFKAEGFKKLLEIGTAVAGRILTGGKMGGLLERLFSSLTPDQFETLGKVLSPEQVAIVNELIAAHQASAAGPDSADGGDGAGGAGAAQGDQHAGGGQS
jgi:hypothetical protein